MGFHQKWPGMEIPRPIEKRLMIAVVSHVLEFGERQNIALKASKHSFISISKPFDEKIARGAECLEQTCCIPNICEDFKTVNICFPTDHTCKTKEMF